MFVSGICSLDSGFLTSLFAVLFIPFLSIFKKSLYVVNIILCLLSALKNVSKSHLSIDFGFDICYLFIYFYPISVLISECLEGCPPGLSFS